MARRKCSSRRRRRSPYYRTPISLTTREEDLADDDESSENEEEEEEESIALEEARTGMERLSLELKPEEKKSDIVAETGGGDGGRALRPCCVCLDPDRESEVLFMPCFHCCVCTACARKIKKQQQRGSSSCPKCRAPIVSSGRVYF